MVNKGRTHREIRDFLGIFEIQSNRMMKCGEILGKLIFFLEIRLKGDSMELKITEIRSRFAEKSMSEWDRNFWIWKSQKIEIEIEID